MAIDQSPDHRLLVLLESPTDVPETTRFALEKARDGSADLGEPIEVEFRVLESADEQLAANAVAAVDRVTATFDLCESVQVDVTTADLPVTEDLDQVEALSSVYEPAELSRVIVEGDTALSVPRLRTVFGADVVELSPRSGQAEQRNLLHAGGWRRVLSIFGITYIFYLSLGGFVLGLDLLTGALSAGATALFLSRVALVEEPTVSRTGLRLARFAVFLPVLFWDVLKANLAMAYVILHPKLPIDPETWTLESEMVDDMEQMVLANSITLTPGTLAVDVDGTAFTIHSLTRAAKSDLRSGRLQELVSWVFHGKKSAEDGSDERGETR